MPTLKPKVKVHHCSQTPSVRKISPPSASYTKETSGKAQDGWEEQQTLPRCFTYIDRNQQPRQHLKFHLLGSANREDVDSAMAGPSECPSQKQGRQSSSSSEELVRGMSSIQMVEQPPIRSARVLDHSYAAHPRSFRAGSQFDLHMLPELGHFPTGSTLWEVKGECVHT